MRIRQIGFTIRVLLKNISCQIGREVDVFETAKLYPHIQGLTIEN